MRGRTPTAGEGPPACPFIAFAEEADSRAGGPDHRHRCYAQEPAEPRAYAHQERYCLTSAYPGCAYFQDWAVRSAAESVAASSASAARQFEERGRSGRAAAAAAAAMSQLSQGGHETAEPRGRRRARDADESGYATEYPADAYAGDRERDAYARDAYAARDGYADAEYARREPARAEYVPDAYAQNGSGRAERNGYARDAASTNGYAEDDHTASGYAATDYAAANARDQGPVRGVQYAREPEYAAVSNGAHGANGVANGTRPRPGSADANGRASEDPYSGYPTAARLLGIAPPQRDDYSTDDAPEPGKWQRSGRLQTWLEDAEGTRANDTAVTGPAPAAAVAEIDDEYDEASMEAGVIATRPSQARRVASNVSAARQAPRKNARPALPWERHAGAEPFAAVRESELRRSAGGSRIPLIVGAGLLLVAAIALFMLPGLASPRKNTPSTGNRAAQVPAAATATPTAEPTEATPTEAAAPTPRVYRVVGGDTLSRIASKFRVSVQDILDANADITDPKRIHIGQKINIPSPSP